MKLSQDEKEKIDKSTKHPYSYPSGHPMIHHHHSPSLPNEERRRLILEKDNEKSQKRYAPVICRIHEAVRVILAFFYAYMLLSREKCFFMVYLNVLLVYKADESY